MNWERVRLAGWICVMVSPHARSVKKKADEEEEEIKIWIWPVVGWLSVGIGYACLVSTPNSSSDLRKEEKIFCCSGQGKQMK